MKSILLAGFLLICSVSFSQTVYPKVGVYAGILHPLVTYSNTEPQYNFQHAYTVGVPVGINYWKTAKAGLSFEFVPIIRADAKTSRMNNFLFHPGVLVSMGHGYTFVGRAAFETSGRYGITPVFSKIIKRNKNASYYIAVPLPARFGNDRPASFTIAFQFGIVL